MAKQQIVSFTYTCDVCGEEISESDVGSAARTIGWQSGDYIVDVCTTHQAELSEILDQLKIFVDSGRRSGSAGRRRGSSASSATGAASPARGRRRSGATLATSSPASIRRDDLPAIRSWAQQHGHRVGDRGRIPGRVVAAYDEFHGSTAVSVPRKRGTSRAEVASE